MFDRLPLKEWDILEHHVSLGKINANMEGLQKHRLAELVTREALEYQVVQVGTFDAEAFDAFIIKALNTMYQEIETAPVEIREKKIADYKHLYEIWNSILEAKKMNSETVQELYDDLFYALTVLGYQGL